MDYRAKYEEWLAHLPAEDALGAELRSITEDAEIEDRFYQDLRFGTAGLRGKVGAGTNRMNVFTVGRATQGIARFINAKDAGSPGRFAERGIVITHDVRHFSREFAQLAAEILAANGIRVYTFPDIRSTPMLAFMIRRLGAAGGINITASHNPREYNGFKVYWEDGCQVGSEIADPMTACIDDVDTWTGIRRADFDEAVRSGRITVLGPEYDREYLDKIESLAIHTGEELDLSIPLVYTPLNGCGAIPFRTMLEDRGFTNWQIVPEQTEPDPDFTTVGYPNPEDPKSFRLSEEYGRRFGAELLLSTDPDADRFAIEIRDGDGNYVPLNGNQTGYILAAYILEGRADAGTLPPRGAMVKSIVTSTLSTRMAAAYGVTMFETLTGFKNISGVIPRLQEEGYTYLFGYEESVGYAACEDIRDKDGISAGMLVAEAAAYYRRQGRTLWDVLQSIYQRFGCFAEDEPNLVLEGIPGTERIGRMMASLRSGLPASVAGSKVLHVIDYALGFPAPAGNEAAASAPAETGTGSAGAEAFASCDPATGTEPAIGTVPTAGSEAFASCRVLDPLQPHNALRIFLENGSWFAIRPSGTEPKIKFYFYSCGDTMEDARRTNAAVRDEILHLVQSVE